MRIFRAPVKTYRRLLSFLKPYRLRIALTVGMALLAAAAGAAYVYLIGPLFQLLVGKEGGGLAPLGALPRLTRADLAWALPLGLVGAGLIRGPAQALQNYLTVGTGQRVIADLRRALYHRFLTLPLAWLHRQQSGELLARFGSDVQIIESGLTFSVANAVSDALQLFAYLAVCALIDWRLFLVAMVGFPIAAFPIARLGKVLRRSAQRYQADYARLVAQVAELFANVRILQAFVREKEARARHEATQATYFRSMLAGVRSGAVGSPLIEFLGIAGASLAIYLATPAIAKGLLRPEVLPSFLAAFMMAYRPMKELARSGGTLMQAIASGDRIFAVLDAPDRLPEPSDAAPLRFENSLAFEGVSFAYEQGGPVLRDVELSLPKGQMLALVGESGSGKSTLASLLLRFHDPTAGAVTIDGRDLRTARLADLRGLIAYVPQEPVLFSGTIRENILCGALGGEGGRDGGEAELLRAVEAANASEFIQALPEGLDTRLGERGAGLSGGQRQRIALARAFLANTPIVLLDEATSALDGASEAKVQEGIEHLFAGRTAVVIAHRLSTIARADTIAVLDQGRVIEQGTHASLLAAGGAYASLWNAQRGVAA